MMLNIARLLYSMLYSFRELRASPVLAQQLFMSDQYGSVTLKTHLFIDQPYINVLLKVALITAKNE